MNTEEPHNSTFQGTYGFYALSRKMPYCQYFCYWVMMLLIFHIELKEKTSRGLEFMLLWADFSYWRMPYCRVPL